MCSHEQPPFRASAGAGYVELFRRVGSGQLIRNTNVDISSVDILGETIPIVLSEISGDASYVCSPFTSYVSYLLEELPKLQNTPLERLLAPMIKVIGRALRHGEIDRAILVNNWLLSTNLYRRQWRGEALPSLRRELCPQFPGRAIIFRSLNAKTNLAQMNALVRDGYRLLPSRQVYFFDGKNAAFAKHSNTKRDIRLLSDNVFRFSAVSPETTDMNFWRQAEALYRMLYIDKYSAYNPQFTSRYLHAMNASRTMTFHQLRHGSRLVGILGFFEMDNVLTAPIVGYDTRMPQSLALYRRLMARVFSETLERRRLLNLSAGAGHFKRLRGGKAAMEYSAVFYSHLPTKQKIIWRSLIELVQRIGEPILTRFEL